jgi:hypothetical protein
MWRNTEITDDISVTSILKSYLMLLSLALEYLITLTSRQTDIKLYHLYEYHKIGASAS